MSGARRKKQSRWQRLAIRTSLIGLIAGVACASAPDQPLWLRAIWLAVGLLYGPLIVMSCYLGQRSQVRRLGGGETEEDLAVHQTRRFVLPFAFDEAFDACVASLRTVRWCRVTRRDRVAGIVRGWQAPRTDSFGNTVEFRLICRGDKQTEVSLVSHPTITVALVDYGTNFDIAERVTARLGVKPEHYLLRPAANGGPNALLRAAGSAGDSSSLLQPAAESVPVVQGTASNHDNDHDQQSVQGGVGG